jgi:hypothetical protein
MSALLLLPLWPDRQEVRAVADITKPFTQEQVRALNQWQTSGSFHPFTCPDDGTDLIAAEAGWWCPHGPCQYRQTWAHDFMARPTGADQ